jgi:hypothetical protein
MKILCIADIHGDLEGVKRAREYAVKNGIEDVLILGDFPSHGMFHDVAASMFEIRRSLDQLRGLNVLAIPGNCDPVGSPELFEEYGVNLHERIKEIGGMELAGFGGSNITPFGTPFEMPEEEIYSRLGKLLSSCHPDKTVFAVHCPPRDTNCDRTGNGMHAGSGAVRKALEEFQPALAVCSHIHESGGSSDVIGRTIVANVGRLSEGRIGVLELGGNVGISLERI